MAVNLSNTAGPLSARWPAWSPDRTKIAFWYGSGNGLQHDAEIYLNGALGARPAGGATCRLSTIS